MAEQPSFWRRVGSFLRGEQAGDVGLRRADTGSASRTASAPRSVAADTVVPMGTARHDDVAGTTAYAPPGSELAAAPAPPLEHDRGRPLARAAAPARNPLAWWQRRQVRQAQTREMALRMVELADALQEHFRRQDQRATELAGALQHVGSVLEQVADGQRAGGETLQRIAAQAEAAGRHNAVLGETLGQIPESLKAQADAIRGVARSMEIGQESSAQLMLSLQQFGRAVDTLGSSGSAQVEVLQKLNAAQRDQHAALTGLVREQGRRLIVVSIVLGVLAVAALATLTVVLLRAAR